MIVDCDTCIARGPACGDCVVTVVLGAATAWGDDEQRALAVLAGSGLVPPLRLTPPDPAAPPAGSEQPGQQRPARRHAG